jgi:hypothetical protein
LLGTRVVEAVDLLEGGLFAVSVALAGDTFGMAAYEAGNEAVVIVAEVGSDRCGRALKSGVNGSETLLVVRQRLVVVGRGFIHR